MSLIRLMALAVPVLALGAAAFAAEPAAVVAPEPALTKAEIPALVKEAIMNDPEILMQALEKLRIKKAEEAKKAAAAALEQYKAELYEAADVPSFGASAKDADVTIVEFFDYHCGYCKHFLPELSKLVAEDKKLRVRFIDLPILGEDSVLAARAALAVHRISPNKYFNFHSALMQETGKFDEQKLIEVAKKSAVSVPDMQAEMKKPEVTAMLDRNRNVADKLGISGTPGLIIGGEVVSGSMSYDELKKTVESIRKAKKVEAEAKKAEAKAKK